VWVDVENAPQVQYLMPFAERFARLGHAVVATAPFSPVVIEMLGQRGVPVEVVGVESVASRRRKIAQILARASKLAVRFRRCRPDLVVATSRSASLAARWLGSPCFAICDYEYVDTRAWRVAGTYVFHPALIPSSEFVEHGLRPERLLPFEGLKEEISLAGGAVDSLASATVPIRPPGGATVLFRPPGEQAHYHVPESLRLARELLAWLAQREDAQVIYSPRYPEQEAYVDQLEWAHEPHVLRESVPFVPLLRSVDLVISAGGTMAREAAFLGVPAYSIFRSRPGAVDRHLAQTGRLTLIENPDAFHRIRLTPAQPTTSLYPPKDLVGQLSQQMLTITTERSQRHRRGLPPSRKGQHRAGGPYDRQAEDAFTVRGRLLVLRRAALPGRDTAMLGVSSALDAHRPGPLRRDPPRRNLIGRTWHPHIDGHAALITQRPDGSLYVRSIFPVTDRTDVGRPLTRMERLRWHLLRRPPKRIGPS
jgi:predicted glycosyltransferase